jgi:hypothetical protein
MATNSLLIDYIAKTVKQLRVVLTRRGITHKHLKLKAQLVATLDEADRPQREAAEERDRLKREADRLEQETLTITIQAIRPRLQGRSLSDFVHGPAGFSSRYDLRTDLRS